VSPQLSSARLTVEPPSKLMEEKEELIAIVDDNQSICVSVSNLIEHPGL
jgi:hypothetical protein